MALISTFTPTTVGTAPTFAAAAAGDTARPGKHALLVVKNTNAATRDITLKYPGTLPSGDAIPDKVYTIAATTGELWIPLLPEYADPATSGQVVITWSATTNVTRAVINF
jgi:hypothetical protein